MHIIVKENKLSAVYTNAHTYTHTHTHTRNHNSKMLL
jgi:hypothetical protein